MGIPIEDHCQALSGVGLLEGIRIPSQQLIMSGWRTAYRMAARAQRAAGSRSVPRSQTGTSGAQTGASGSRSFGSSFGQGSRPSTASESATGGVGRSGQQARCINTQSLIRRALRRNRLAASNLGLRLARALARQTSTMIFDTDE